MTAARPLAERLFASQGAGGPFPPHLDRVRPPEATVATMWARAREFGVTRLGAVTGLDRIGIPVWAAMRPNGRTLALSQGKGVDDAAARASALMEAVELAVAERRPSAPLRTTLRALREAGRDADPLPGLLLAGATPLGDDDEIAWIDGVDLLSGATVHLPLDAIVLDDSTVAARWWQSTDGLASGNVVWEAVLHGLLERIERDALTLWSLRGDAHVAARCLDPATAGDPILDDLLDRIAAADLQIRLFDLTTDLGVPTVMAILSPPPTGFEERWKHFDVAMGSGSHPDPVRAALRAVTEAAQSRLTSIAAARDDVQATTYDRTLRADLLPYVRLGPARPMAGERRDDRAGHLPDLLARLTAAGIPRVIAVPLAEDDDFAVVKMVVPGLENPAGRRRSRFGRRALAVMTGGA